jgi:hypothetical protein
MNPYWKRFIEEVTWCAEPHMTAVVGPSEAPGSWAPKSEDFARLFPELNRLLETAYIARAVVSDRPYQFFTWPSDGSGCRSWLSPWPSFATPSGLFRDHQVLLESFGGIIENSNAPEGWWGGAHYDVLTEQEAQRDATFLNYCASAFEQESLTIPIDPEQFYSIAAEASFEITLCHRTTGEVIFFSSDCVHDYVEVYPGCPEQTLYRLIGAPTFGDYVETIARQWAGQQNGARPAPDAVDLTRAAVSSQRAPGRYRPASRSYRGRRRSRPR